VFGGEGNGGLIFPDHQFCRDGGMTAASMAAILAATGDRLSDIVKRLPKRFMIKEKQKTLHAQKMMAKIEQSFTHDQIDHTDGLKITRGSTWALIRASGTEPLIRIIVESGKRTDAEIFFKEISGIISQESGK
jgi:phosphomannomutase/phosphoglucomutase